MSVNAEYAIEEGERRPLVDQACADAIKCTEEKAPPATGTFFGSTFNIMNAIMGSGILGLAYAARESGVVLFTLLMLMMVAFATYACILLLRMCTLTGKKSYEAIGDAAFGRKGVIAVSISICVQNIAGATSYLVICGDLLPDIINALGHIPTGVTHIYSNRDFLVSLVTVCIVFPLASMRQIGLLGYTSGVSIFLMIIFMIMVIYEHSYIPCPLNPLPPNSTNATLSFVSPSLSSPLPSLVSLADSLADQCKVKLVTFNIQTVFSFPTMAFSFVCHTALLPVYAELKGATEKRMQRIVYTSMSGTFLIYFLSGIFGYLTFYDQTGTDLLQTYSLWNPNNTFVIAVRLMFVTAVILTVPVVLFPSRKTLTLLFWGYDAPFSWLRHMTITVVLVGTCLILALFVPDIVDVFGVAGATSSISLVFLLPCSFYLRLFEGPWKSKRKLPVSLMLAAGSVIGVVCIGGVIASFIVT